MKITLKTAIIFAAVILVLIPTAINALAYPLDTGNGRERGHVRPLIEPMIMGHGFALNGDEYHILDVNAIRMSDASPGFVRSLLWQKKSPEEIAKEINDAQLATRIRAHIRFAGEAYALDVTGYDNRSLTGDVLTLPPRGTEETGFTPASVGHLSLSISRYEGEVVSTGTLTMNNTDYKVLLTSPMRIGKW